MKKYFTQRNIYIGLFAMLYFATALVSTIHAVSFFCLANVMALGVLLAITFEIGQAATLFSILTSKKERSKIMPWVLMFILTGVQVLGNVFSSYRYLITNSADQLRFFKEPIFVWMELPDQQANVILTYIIGAVLPIVALALTGMLTNYLEDIKQETNQEHKDVTQLNGVDDGKLSVENHVNSIEPSNEEEKTITENPDNTDVNEEKPIVIEEVKHDEPITEKKSHFINI